MSPYLSIIVPVYKIEQYLSDCVDSILVQKFKDFELILVDDGSPDASPKICDEYARTDARVKVIHKTNGGLISARKVGLQNASGEYVGFVDGDDWIEPDMYEKMCFAAQKHKVDIAICDVIRNYKTGEEKAEQNYGEGIFEKESLIRDIYPTMLYNGKFGGRGLFPSVCNKIYRRRILENNLYKVDERIQIGEDMACTYPCLLEAKSVYMLKDQFLYHYRQNDSSMVNRYKDDYFNRSLILFSLLNETNVEKGVFDITDQVLQNLSYFAITSIENEFHKNNLRSFNERFKQIREICYNKDVNKALGLIQLGKLSAKNIIYVFLAKHRLILCLFVFSVLLSRIRWVREKIKRGK